MNPPPTRVQPVLDYAPADSGGGQSPVATVVRVCGLAAGVIAAVVCFATSFAKHPLRATWHPSDRSWRA